MLVVIQRRVTLLIRRLSINVTLKSLLLVARIEKSSKSGVWLQNKRCSLMAEWSSPLTLFQWVQKFPSVRIWPVWLNVWVFVYERSGYEFESRCCDLKVTLFFRYSEFFPPVMLLLSLKRYLERSLYFTL